MTWISRNVRRPAITALRPSVAAILIAAGLTVTAPAAAAAPSDAGQPPVAKCTAFGEALKTAEFGLTSVAQIQDARGVCRWSATGLAQPAVLEAYPRAANSAQADQRDREVMCADITAARAAQPQSARAKRIVQQVRSNGLTFDAAGPDNGLATVTAHSPDGKGGISLGCDTAFAYETRVYRTQPVPDHNLSGTALVFAHRG